MEETRWEGQNFSEVVAPQEEEEEEEEGLIPRSLQLQSQVTLASLGCCDNSGGCAKSCARRPVCFCSQSSGDVSIGLLT